MSNVTVEINNEIVQVIEILDVGIQGPAGDGTGAGALVVAEENLGSSSFVFVQNGGAVPAYGPSRPAFGFTKPAVTAGQSALVISGGPLNGLSGLTRGAEYYLGVNAGSITSTPPTSGLLQRLGVASATDTLLVDIAPPVMLV